MRGSENRSSAASAADCIGRRFLFVEQLQERLDGQWIGGLAHDIDERQPIGLWNLPVGQAAASARSRASWLPRRIAKANPRRAGFGSHPQIASRPIARRREPRRAGGLGAPFPCRPRARRTRLRPAPRPAVARRPRSPRSLPPRRSAAPVAAESQCVCRAGELHASLRGEQRQDLLAIRGRFVLDRPPQEKRNVRIARRLRHAPTAPPRAAALRPRQALRRARQLAAHDRARFLRASASNRVGHRRRHAPLIAEQPDGPRPHVFVRMREQLERQWLVEARRTDVERPQ